MNAAAIVNHLWQSTVFVAVAGLTVLALRNNAARIRYWVWFAASLKFLVPFAALTWLGSRLSWLEAPSAAGEAQALVQTLQEIAAPAGPSTLAAATFSPASFDFLSIGIAIWLVGGLAFALRWLLSWHAIAKEVRTARRLEMDLPVPVKSSAKLHEPVIVGIVRPVMLLPEGITERLSAIQMRAIVAHELCHARHRDNLTAAIHMIVEVLFWFHPLVWWIGARLVDERERACDEAVLASGTEPERYAEGILKVCQFYVESNIECVAGISGADLKQRIEAIMKNRVASKLDVSRRTLLSLAATAAVVAPFAMGVATGTSSPGSASTPIAFDIVQITPSAKDPNAGTAMMMKTGGRFQVRNISLRRVIAQAYGVQSSLVVGGPAWLDEPRYDIDARSSVEVDVMRDRDAMQNMIRALLTREFGLIAHTETQQPSTYVLRVDQGGSKLRATDRNSGNMGMKLGKDGVEGMRAPMKVLTDYLAMRLEQPVADQTGLSGAYDFELKSTFNDATLPQELKEQLGLTLERQLVSTQVVVVDRALEPAI